MSQGYAGYGGNVMAGANDVDMQQWNFDHEINAWDSTTTANLGWDDTNAGTQKLSGSFDILYNPSKTPFSTLGLAAGATPTLQLYINKTAGNYATGQAIITKTSVKTPVKEGIILTISFNNKGVWTLPS